MAGEGLMMEELRRVLDSRGPGPVAEEAWLVDALAAIWDGLMDADQESMTSWKLNRMENPRWEPPNVVFEIERHGSTVMGSTRGEVQINTVIHEYSGHKQTVQGRRKRLKAELQSRMADVGWCLSSKWYRREEA